MVRLFYKEFAPMEQGKNDWCSKLGLIFENISGNMYYEQFDIAAQLNDGLIVP